MQRIGEYTYIDETLITCVEYQLFVDEMLRRGKYFQPDHWISVQFQNGLARSPVVGVRTTDAVAFCEWLTKREVEGKWYRLPTDMEVSEYPIKPNQYSLPLGYWIHAIDGRFNFIGKNPNTFNPREIDRSLFVQKAVDFAINLEHNAHRKPYPNLADDLNKALDRAAAVNLDRGRGLDDHLDYALNFVLDRGKRLEDNHNHNRAIDNALVHALAHALNSVHSQESTNYNIELAFDVYTDLYTMQERIARRSPPFEGIRLVKELSR